MPLNNSYSEKKKWTKSRLLPIMHVDNQLLLGAAGNERPNVLALFDADRVFLGGWHELTGQERAVGLAESESSVVDLSQRAPKVLGVLARARVVPGAVVLERKCAVERTRRRAVSGRSRPCRKWIGNCLGRTRTGSQGRRPRLEAWLSSLCLEESSRLMLVLMLLL